MVQCLSAFLDACYIVRQADIDENALRAFQTALAKFHFHREIFRTAGVRENFSLPRQHSLVHYRYHVQEFGAPNGLCSSITESRHITAVKKPWRRSNRYEALGQMLMTNQRLDKLSAARVDFVSRGMLPPTHSPPPTKPPDDDDDDDENPVDDERVAGHVVLARTRIRKVPSEFGPLEPPVKVPRDLEALSELIDQPGLPELTRRFLYDQLHPNGPLSSNDIPLETCPIIRSKISMFHSAVATFYATSDQSGIRGMRRERIRSTSSWRGRGPRHDCAFVVEDQDKPGMKGMRVVRVKLFFSFEHKGEVYPCALVEWFKVIGRSPDIGTGMWRVKPEYDYGARSRSVLHLDSFMRGAHLIPVFGDCPLPIDFHYSYSLDAFEAYYINKYADHHAHELIF